MSQNKHLTLLQINDTHAYLELHPELFWGPGGAEYRPAGGYARLATLVRDVRKENPGGVLLFDNGDTLHGTYPAVHTQGQALVPILNALQPQAMTAHWEFAYGPETFRQRAAELDFPVLALNIRKEANGELFFPAYRLYEAAGLRVGVIGLASNIVDKTMPPSFSKGLRFGLGLDELPEIVQRLRVDEKAGLIVLLSHLGFPQDMQLVSQVPGIDVVLSGHTHNRLYRPAHQGNTLVIQSGSHGSFLGRLDLQLENGKVARVQHRLVTIDPSIPPDPQVATLVDAAMAPFSEYLDEVVGETSVPLDRGLNLETTMDNLLLSALQEHTGAQLAFANGWRYGAPILPGTVTLGDLHHIIPVDPPVSTTELAGEELRGMLEENLEHTFSHQPFQQMGGYVKRALGLKAYIKIENPHGQRIQKLFVGEEEVQPGQVYSAAFVTEQGVPAKYGRNRQKHSESAVDTLRSYLATHRPFTTGLHGTFIVV